MGGVTTEITDATRDVLIEAAGFDQVSIARTARRHKLPSEASKRFARGVDPMVAAAAAERAVELLERYAGGTRDTLGASVFEPGAGQYAPVHLAHDAVLALTGMEVDRSATAEILRSIGATVDETDAGLTVTPPSWRPDIVDAPGVVEEVARIVGYDKIPSALPPAPSGRGLSHAQAARRRLVNALAASGMTEVLAYPFVSHEDNVLFGQTEDDVVLANALDSLLNRMRVSLVPGLLETAQRNLSRGFTSLALYEVGLVFHGGPGSLGTTDIPEGAQKPDTKVAAKLYASTGHQPWTVAGVFLGNALEKTPGSRARAFEVADALDAARTAARATGAELTVVQATHPAFHPGRYAWLLVGERVVGFVGELLPRIARTRDLVGRVAVFSLDIDALIAARGQEPHAAKPLSIYPAATQDVSLVASLDVPAAALRDVLIEGCGELVESAFLVDDYRGEGIDTGQRSLTFALRFRASDRTLTQAEATEAKERGVALAAKKFGAVLRA
jgi:phenylalanyl-tRNA synthetase beta chain